LNLTEKEIQAFSRQLKSSSPLRLDPYLQCIDHTVSRETFTLYRDADRDMLITFPQPTEENLALYYESEDYISHTDSKRNLLEMAYQAVKKVSLKRKLKLIRRLNSGAGTLLDVGCGTGDFIKTCQEGGWTVAGVEPNEKALSLAQFKTDSANCYSSIEQLLDSSNKTYDVITLWHVLEHIPNLYDRIEQLKNLLKPDGSLVVAVPNFKSSDAQHYGAHWAAYDVPRHLWHFSRHAMRRIFSDFNMQVAEERPLPFDSFYASLLSEKYQYGRQNYVAAFLNGLRSNMKARRSGEYSSLIYVVKRSK